MSKRLAWLIAVALPALTVLPCEAAERVNVRLADDLECAVIVPFVGSMMTGACLPVRFEFTNRGPDRAVRTVFEANGSIGATHSVPGNGSVARWMYVPLVGEGFWAPTLAFYDADTGRVLSRQEWEGFRYMTPTAWSAGGTGAVTALVVSAGPSPTVSSNLCEPASIAVTNLSPDMVPDSWLALSGVELVIVPYQTWASPRMRAEPILDWVAMGGVCLVVDASAEGRQAVLRAVSESLPAVECSGDTVAAGLGRLVFVESAVLMRSRVFAGRQELGIVDWASRLSRSNLQPPLPVVVKPPFVPVLFFLIVFSLLVGPVGWWYMVSKRGRPLMYYALAPVLSVCAIALMVVADLLKQGVRPRAACVGAELIDQRTKKRITLSQFVVYCPFTMGQVLRSAPDELPYFLSLGGGGLSVGIGGVSGAAAGSQVLYRDALPARERAWFARQCIRLERRRLEIWKEDGQIRAENHLGVPLRGLVVCFQGEYALLNSLDEREKGVGAPLERAAAISYCARMLGNVGHHAGLVTARASGLSRRWQKAFESGQNSYAALREESLEDLTWLPSARLSGSVAVVRGYY